MCGYIHIFILAYDAYQRNPRQLFCPLEYLSTEFIQNRFIRAFAFSNFSIRIKKMFQHTKVVLPCTNISFVTFYKDKRFMELGICMNHYDNKIF